MAKSVPNLPAGLALLLFVFPGDAAAQDLTYPIVDTGQVTCYGNTRKIAYPRRGKSFHGQDVQYAGLAPAYRDNGDGTVTDLNTGLMWQKQFKAHTTWDDAVSGARRFKLAGHSDWRLPDIKELYSLIDFRGYTGFSRAGTHGSAPANAVPYINTDYFDFEYGDVSGGERYIDAQYWSSTQYVSTTMGGNETAFGVNFADGRIKGYPSGQVGTPSRRGRSRAAISRYARYVRGNTDYGKNQFIDNGNGTITDRATGLMWMSKDSGKGMDWSDALKYAENQRYAGHSDWRLPNVKELQSIVDYSRSPDTTGSAAIDPMFRTSSIKNEAGDKDYPCFWSSTTHLDGPQPGSNGAYVAFGRALGQMRGTIMDVHGAGAQRSDPKTGKPVMGHGPQGDARRVFNYVRCVRGGAVKIRTSAPSENRNEYPHNVEQVDSERQERSGPPPGRAGFVERLDRNGDGKVSRSEFDGPRNRFNDHDRNRDGYLTEDEAPQGPPPRGGRRPRP